jgi:hypothetical protein
LEGRRRRLDLERRQLGGGLVSEEKEEDWEPEDEDFEEDQ